MTLSFIIAAEILHQQQELRKERAREREYERKNVNEKDKKRKPNRQEAERARNISVMRFDSATSFPSLFVIKSYKKLKVQN